MGFGIVVAISILYSVGVGQNTLIFFKDTLALIIGSGIVGLQSACSLSSEAEAWTHTALREPVD